MGKWDGYPEEHPDLMAQRQIEEERQHEERREFERQQEEYQQENQEEEPPMPNDTKPPEIPPIIHAGYGEVWEGGEIQFWTDIPASDTRPAIVVPDMTPEEARAGLWPELSGAPLRQEAMIDAVKVACHRWPAAVLVLLAEEVKRRMEEKRKS